MQKQLLLLTIAALAAGGCSHGDEKKNPVVDAKPETPTTYEPVTDVNGSYLHINAEKVVTEGQLKGKKLDSVEISGHPLTLEPPTTKEGVHEEKKPTADGKSYTRYLLSDTMYDQTRFGLAQTGQEFTLFSHGHLTREMPQQGAYIYNGHAAISLQPRENEETGYSGAATAISSVDFGKRSIEVAISTPEVTPREINFSATIHGNTFSGDQGFISDGGFYGQNAAELSGYFIDKKNNFGVFGGKKLGGIKH